MQNRNKKKSIKLNFLTFLKYINDLIKLIIQSNIEYLISFFKKMKIKYYEIIKKIPINIIIKQVILLFMFLYYLFQIVHPNGFLINYIKKNIKYYNLQNEISELEIRNFYINNTLNAINVNNEDVIEELMIKNTGKQINSQREYLFISEESNND